MEPNRAAGGRDPLLALLDEVVQHGAPAQRGQAEELRTLIDSGKASPEVEAQAVALVDAYRNDPYLWR